MPPIRVLVVDDSMVTIQAISKVLTADPQIQVVGRALDGARAIREVERIAPDVVTMDIIMPEMGGIEAVKKITSMDPAARILMCSAMGQQALVQEALQAGARDFVVKPFQPSRVLEAVQRVLA